MQKSKSFILPMFKLPSYVYNYVETYMGNVLYEGNDSWGNYFYVACSPDEITDSIKNTIKSHTQFRAEFHEADKVFYVFDFTESQKNLIVNPFLNGQYSKIDRSYVETNFPKFTPTGTVSTNWRILIKDEWDIPANIVPLRQYWYQQINSPEIIKYGRAVSLPDNAEVWSRPMPRDEVYGYELLEEPLSNEQISRLIGDD